VSGRRYSAQAQRVTQIPSLGRSTEQHVYVRRNASHRRLSGEYSASVLGYVDVVISIICIETGARCS
jgi:hypothetical protein